MSEFERELDESMVKTLMAAPGKIEPYTPAPVAGFNNQQLATRETSAMAMAAREKAAIEARYVMAIHRPRDIETARVGILSHCKRLRFAEEARYRKPVGKKKNEKTGKWEDQFIEGPSIRFADTAIQEYRNCDTQAVTVYDDDHERHILVQVIDLERNIAHRDTVVVVKTIERRQLKKGQVPIGERVNSYGDPVFILPATDDEVMIKQNALISKSRRNLTLRIIPRDIVDEAMELCVATVREGINADPQAAKRRVLDAFVAIGLKPADVEQYLGHSLDQVTPRQIEDLRVVYSAINSGEVTWREVVQAARIERGEVEEEDNVSDGAKKLKDALEKKREAKKAPAQKTMVEIANDVMKKEPQP